ncbi:hypothetical protein GLOIN_2v640326 [Rhizophagus irregularis DAOM 181602=DAOM 197198]|uniref:Uncharacterized protein n=1 Tax=Rhizophagus irregularis (strain DAOM 181602 / DAOM 197198 / MUCL 43194) TaxID=747089 RepID=A0A2P4QLS7_RHIID|nr:hypothetical protein GLOIN_2v640326 [Rhizophagus irregularis DAOM 181602=DAOM 197198]POG78576.1 hypothetical protein GLOIN_2v640326 [Rhizophagus irregularis DAOM 181602=DAOM 197198]GET61935.1 hypothetical protein GLOIN_2v640326 [Rhizophagus irregularis DAOM 181602=DAOM 197198]|eukprot:XP_025185442.1 hypothetical protein GLOIN_2v640326 [Rhizophagus irregularis DAOM 181602=DAOM 197198]
MNASCLLVPFPRFFRSQRYFSFLLFLFLTYILLTLCFLLLYFIIFRSFSPSGSAIKVQLFFTLRFVSYYSFFIFFYFVS